MQNRREKVALVRSFLNGALLAKNSLMRDSELTAHDFQFTAINGEPLPLTRFKGQVLLVVNTASRCGLTPQYSKLQHLWDAYRERGLVVLGVPCNNFGGQEPGTDDGIANFCTTRFDVDFPLTAKTDVMGRDRHPFYAWAAEQVGPLATPKWNFHKYLVSPDGDLVDWFASTTSPMARRITVSIERILPGAMPRSSTPH